MIDKRYFNLTLKCNQLFDAKKTHLTWRSIYLTHVFGEGERYKKTASVAQKDLTLTEKHPRRTQNQFNKLTNGQLTSANKRLEPSVQSMHVVCLQRDVIAMDKMCVFFRSMFPKYDDLLMVEDSVWNLEEECVLRLL